MSFKFGFIFLILLIKGVAFRVMEYVFGRWALKDKCFNAGVKFFECEFCSFNIRVKPVIWVLLLAGLAECDSSENLLVGGCKVIGYAGFVADIELFRYRFLRV